MSLEKLELLHQYRPNKSNIVDDFYIPCLINSNRYQRAVGYFNSGSLALAAKGLSHFLYNNGKMELIASPQLEEEDIEAIRLGYQAREEIITKALLRHIPETDDPIINQRLGFLAWMISRGQLEIKIAIVEDDHDFGIYHEKIGCFFDDKGNVVAFSGSSNETRGGLYSNFELIEVYCSWRNGDTIRVENKISDFNDLWKNQTKHLTIIDFPEAARQNLLKKQIYVNFGQNDPESYNYPDPMVPESFYQTNTSSGSMIKEYGQNYYSPRIPKNLIIRNYQKNAVSSWFKNNGSGIFAMATGSGKTITALTTAVKLYEKIGFLGLIIVCPYIDLVEQWAKEVKKFGMSPILAYDSKSRWEGNLNSAITSYNMGVLNHFSVIMTNATFLSDTMQESLLKLNRPTLIIADEAHHLGAQHLSKKLPTNIPYRLALSATPRRWFDEEGTEKLISYFNPGIISEFGLKDAIKEGFLTQYRYYPHIVCLTDEEFEQYYEISKKITKMMPMKGELDLEDSGLQYLLIERARILSRAINKLSLLEQLVEPNKETNFNIFYCGDSRIGDERQIELVIKLLGNNLGMKVHPFTSGEDKTKRKELLELFEKGKIQGLVAIRCLDEGIDIPATRTAYILASSTNPREFTQRRGRVLRKYPGKDYSIVHDFIVVPRKLEEIHLIEEQVFNIERRLVKRELLRVIEFAELAENGPQAMLSLQDFKKAYNLLDL